MVKTSSNLMLQLTALVVFVVMRSVTPPGWMLAFFLFLLVGPVAVLAPSVLAERAWQRFDLLPRRLAVAYQVAAISLVTAGALIPDMSDMRSYPAPLAVLIPGLGDRLITVGLWAVLVFVLALVAVLDLQRVGRRELATCTVTDRPRPVQPDA